MSDEQQQYWYNVESDGAPNPAQFGYTGEGIMRNDLLDDFRVTPFGEAGSRLEIDYSVPIGILGAGWTVSLAFKTAIDFTKPLPLDQFSAADSSYVFTPPDIPGQDNQPTTYAVQAVTSIPPQTGEGTPPPDPS